MNNADKDIQVDNPDFETVFMYRDLRLAIGKPYTLNPRTGRPIVRNLGIINEDGKWCYPIVLLTSADIASAVWEAKHRVIDSIIDPGIMDGWLGFPSEHLYRELKRRTNSSGLDRHNVNTDKTGDKA
ncbi:MAG: hypothetical protein ABSA33_04805 [Candidatus Micrarchaeaceae archaeon]